MTPTPDRTGIFGGTFDPLHLGHLAVARQCADRLGLERVLMVPAGSPPHRTAPRAAPEDRLAMVAAAVAGDDQLAACDLEVRRRGPSYTLDTIRDLKRLHPAAVYVLLLGADAALDFGSWRGSRTLAAEVEVAVFNRTGSDPPARERLASAGLPPGVILVEVDSPAISATALRADLAAGRDVADRVPLSVLNLIRERGLYRGEVPGGE